MKVEIGRSEFLEALKGAISRADVIRRLGLPISGSSYKRIRHLALDAGVSLSELPGQAWSCDPIPLTDLPFKMKHEPTRLRKAGVALASAWFLSRGYEVSLPLEPVTYDLVVESEAGFKKIQVKTTNGNVARLLRTSYGKTHFPSTGNYGTSIYREDEVDFFFICTGSGDRYLIPWSITGEKGRISLARYANFKLPSIMPV